jgi:hypothetical protein
MRGVPIFLRYRDELTFEICQEDLAKVYLVCYEFYVLDQVRYFLETRGKEIEFRRTRNQLPNSPSYGCSNRPLTNTQVACTILLRCTQ